MYSVNNFIDALATHGIVPSNEVRSYKEQKVQSTGSLKSEKHLYFKSADKCNHGFMHTFSNQDLKTAEAFLETMRQGSDYVRENPSLNINTMIKNTYIIHNQLRSQALEKDVPYIDECCQKVVEFLKKVKNERASWTVTSTAKWIAHPIKTALSNMMKYINPPKELPLPKPEQPAKANIHILRKSLGN